MWLPFGSYMQLYVPVWRACRCVMVLVSELMDSIKNKCGLDLDET
jgi:hypothetical protein